MTFSDMLALFAFGFSLISGIYAVIVHIRELSRERKQATLDAFNELQAQVLDELAKYSPNAIRVIAEDRRKKDTKPKYNHLKTLIPKCSKYSVDKKERIKHLTER